MLHLFKITIHHLQALEKVAKPAWFIYFILFASGSFAQKGIIKGEVKDEETILPYATVSVANKTAITNTKGEFSIAIIPGTYLIVVTHAGYKKFEQETTIKASETQMVIITMIRADELGEVEVVGSRSSIQRSNLNTAVPVDRISSKDLLKTGQPSLIQMLSFTAPSFNVSRQNLLDPVTLRGLSPDHLLIQLNGIRYHNLSGINPGAIRGTLGRGSVSNDLNSIPFSAIERIDILRDGASAQYGSDAIAGVMNLVLRKTAGKTSINLHLGQHYKGDGESILFGMNQGISLNKKGVLNYSGEFHYRNGTHRGGEYTGTVYYNNPVLDNQRILERGFSRKTPVSNDGSIELSSSSFLVNGGYALSKQTELFWTGSINYRHPVYPGAYRFPKNTDLVNIALYPDGFKNITIIDTWDISAIAGARGKSRNEWNWEFSSALGKNSGSYNLKNTNNASQFVTLGANAPTEFYGGKTIFIQQINMFSLAKDLAKKITGVKTFNIGLGGEYRFEKFKTMQGEEAAWKNYDASGRTQGGAQPTPGISPDDVVDESRRVGALYVDLETDITDRFLINIAGRYENYNDFGSNLAGKMALRYKFASAFSIRGSVSNGYHSPALQQIYYSAISSGFRRGGVPIPVRTGLFRNNHEVTKAFGVKPLKPEKALTLSSGFTSTISPHINLTVDAYWIQIKDRLVLSGLFDRTNPEVDSILRNYPDIQQVQFMTNAINTKTRGIDIVMNGNWKVSKASLGLMLAANFTRTNIFGPIQLADSLKVTTTNTYTLFNREEKEKIENGQPGSKIILSANYKIGKFEFLIRSTRFGKTSAVFSSEDKSRDEFFSPKILTDVSISYSPKTWLTITAGANNIFDVYPDRLKNYLNTTQGILIYGNEAMPFGYNGRYYFLNMMFSW